MKLSFDEIESGNQFEDLVVAYFESLKEDKNIAVKIKPTGRGADGGRDILVTFTITDGIDDFTRTWVIQCKFHQGSISTDKINDVNIPTLLHSYKASGYLLICKGDVTSKLSNLFEKLEKECIFEHKYTFWNGAQFINRITDRKALLKQFFPKYFEYSKRF
jgi:predicted helicase